MAYIKNICKTIFIIVIAYFIIIMNTSAIYSIFSISKIIITPHTGSKRHCNYGFYITYGSYKF